MFRAETLAAAMSKELQANLERLESWLLDEMSVQLETKAAELAVSGTDVANGLSELAAERSPRPRGRPS